MHTDQIISELENFFKSYLSTQGLDLVELIHRYEGRNLVLRLLVDKPEGGISLDECAELNINISKILDEKNIIQDRYILEVSSPGLDRPLKTKNDFSRCITKRVKFFLCEAINGKIEIDGVIKDVSEESVGLQTDKGIVQIPFSIINKAKQII
jgi:ribosome maturation factor RimP